MRADIPLYVLATVFSLYTLLFFAISRLTSARAGNMSFFSADRKAPWPLVAYGTVGASVTGVTYISVPGNVFCENFYYLPMVAGFVAGYFLIAVILLPQYYKMRIISVYSYLEGRLGVCSMRCGSVAFMLSRTLGSAVRVYIVVTVLQAMLPAGTGGGMSGFAVIAVAFIFLLYLYTYRGGVKTMVWTDAVYTTFMLAAVVAAIVCISDGTGLAFGDLWERMRAEGYTSAIDTDISSRTNVFKQFLAGVFLTVAMTGLDQGMMQKNLSCRDIAASRKNMYCTAGIILGVNLCFLYLGGLLALYTGMLGGMEAIGAEGTDGIFPALAGHYSPQWMYVLFLLGLVSASYPSAGAAMTSLTTSVCVDFLGFGKKRDMEGNRERRQRKTVELIICAVFLIIVLLLGLFNSRAVINLIYDFASYTYGPLLGLFAFAVTTRTGIRDRHVPYVMVASPVAGALLNYALGALAGFDFGFSLLIINALLVYFGLFFIRLK